MNLTKESETLMFNEYKTQLIALKTAWGNDENFTRQCVRLLDAFNDKSAKIHWNTKALSSP
jgi:hypothetical protein